MAGLASLRNGTSIDGARRAPAASGDRPQRYRARPSAPTLPARAGSARPFLPMDEAPEWAVDRGAGISSLTTLELLTQLASGDLDGRTRVWREGMECWQPARDVPELALVAGDGATPPPNVVEAFEPSRRRSPLALGLGWALAGAVVGLASVLAALQIEPPRKAPDARAELAAAVAPLCDAATRFVDEATAPIGAMDVVVEPVVRRAEPGQRRLPRSGQR